MTRIERVLNENETLSPWIPIVKLFMRVVIVAHFGKL